MKLEEICDIYSGFAFKHFMNDRQGRPVIKIGNILQDGEIDLVNCSFTNENCKDSFISRKGDIYIALSGATTGKMGLMKADGYLINQRVGIVRLKNNNISNDFLYYLLKSKTMEILDDADGAAQPNISPRKLLDYKFPNYSLKEQNMIMKRLILHDNIIKSYKILLCKLDYLVKARFVEMFGNIKERVRLGNCCDVHARIGWQSLTRDEHMQTGDYMLITGTDFKDGEINYSTCVYVEKKRYEMDKHIILKNDDVLITKDGTIGKVAVVHNLPKPATLNGGVFVVRPDERFNKDYIASVFKGPLFTNYVEQIKTGATIKHLNQKYLVEFNIPVPSVELQEKFADFVKQVDKSKFVVQQSLNKTQELFDSLMQKYFC